jgi:hypothetical protein
MSDGSPGVQNLSTDQQRSAGVVCVYLPKPSFGRSLHLSSTSTKFQVSVHSVHFTRCILPRMTQSGISINPRFTELFWVEMQTVSDTADASRSFDSALNKANFSDRQLYIKFCTGWILGDPAIPA